MPVWRNWHTQRIQNPSQKCTCGFKSHRRYYQLLLNGDNVICKLCGAEFELCRKGSGGKNRIFCYECLPFEPDRNKRNKMRKLALQKYAEKVKLDRGCDICGYNKCAKALEWHHPTDDKKREAAELIDLCFETYVKEIQKCILLCANCHRELHANDAENV